MSDKSATFKTIIQTRFRVKMTTLFINKIQDKMTTNEKHHRPNSQVQ